MLPGSCRGREDTEKVYARGHSQGYEVGVDPGTARSAPTDNMDCKWPHRAPHRKASHIPATSSFHISPKAAVAWLKT